MSPYLTSISGGLSLGLVGSLHCIAMCGPIILSLPISESKALQNSILYTSGRLISYSFLGMVIGALTTPLLYFGFQQQLSIISGIIVILLALKPYLRWSLGFTSLQRFYKLIQATLSKKLNTIQYQRGGYFFVGILNGLLPCGLVYVAIAASLAFADPIQCCLFILAFGMGTSPLLCSIFILKNKVIFLWRNKLQKAVSISIFIMGLLLVMRGANLGIYGLSPKINGEKQKIESCCRSKK